MTIQQLYIYNLIFLYPGKYDEYDIVSIICPGKSVVIKEMCLDLEKTGFIRRTDGSKFLALKNRNKTLRSSK